jgi:hypothetical protein
VRSPGEYGQADKKVQAHCHRYRVTIIPENRIPFPKPDGYDPSNTTAAPYLRD